MLSLGEETRQKRTRQKNRKACIMKVREQGRNGRDGAEPLCLEQHPVPGTRKMTGRGGDSGERRGRTLSGDLAASDL